MYCTYIFRYKCSAKGKHNQESRRQLVARASVGASPPGSGLSSPVEERGDAELLMAMLMLTLLTDSAAQREATAIKTRTGEVLPEMI
jgi:hypothetical protein